MSLLLSDFVGLDPATGLTIRGEAHLRSCLRTLLTTPIRSRVMRRAFGSDVADLIDAPQSPGSTARLVAGVANAIDRFEPRLTLQRVEVPALAPGAIGIDLTVKLTGSVVRLEGVL